VADELAAEDLELLLQVDVRSVGLQMPHHVSQQHVDFAVREVLHDVFDVHNSNLEVLAGVLHLGHVLPDFIQELQLLVGRRRGRNHASAQGPVEIHLGGRAVPGGADEGRDVEGMAGHIHGVECLQDMEEDNGVVLARRGIV